jgi:hypothetical protein
MRSFQPVVAFLLVVPGFGASHARGAGFSLFSNSWGDVIVVTDMTPEGRDLTPPTTGNPVYYRGQSLGCKFGSLPGDRLPEVPKMNRFVAEVLARQGYVGANPGEHEASMYMVVQWGYLRPQSGDLLWFLGYDANKDIGAPAFPGMLGPEVWRRSFRSRTIETVLDYADEPIYGIIVTAFEFSSASTPQPVIYWQTRIGLPANGKSMAQALPAMMLAAGPTIGRETDSPVLRDADDAREGRVELGELEVIGYEDEPAPPGAKTPKRKSSGERE